MRLDTYRVPDDFDRGTGSGKQAIWHVLDALVLGSWLPGSRWRVLLLRAFGARIGLGAVIKPGVRVKFPWKLAIGDHCWIGERVWIDNLDWVTLGDNVCLSQGVYLCTGSHNWARDSFDLIAKPIRIDNCAWVCAGAVLAPGTVVSEGTVITLGSVFSGQATPWTIYVGNPAAAVRERPRTVEHID
ncbi:WcaF family extracellular polysaccharide biosynthesis acetyltransferase [Ruegeria marisrubri]|uniref:WcaF family extracellular polysaccharide biosynthesis acetyltransferase n=1 Tax=Ruegeria marisrubri TaxID=1685379 RepID=UPI0009EC0E39|nr:WcaF family extracellular polysaccharide biosynthesis acetyltransferase [Ruegeria marisrubri]